MPLPFLRTLCLSLWPTLVLSGGFDLRDDTTTSVDPDHWYRAADHWEEILEFAQSFQGPCDLHCVDVFSASQAIAKAFKRRFYRACSWDIKLSTHMDIVTESGCYDLLGLCLRLLPYGLLAAGPPCSLFVWLSCSVHRRHVVGPAGDESLVKVRLSNYITENLAVIIRALMRVKFVQVVIEQPESSTMFSLPMWVTVNRELCFENVGTYMGCFGHFMVKPTTLIGSLTYLSWLGRSLNKKKEALRKKVATNLAKMEKKMGRKLSLVNKQGKSVCGGKDLALSAAYTSQFAAAIFAAWFRAWVLR